MKTFLVEKELFIDVPPPVLFKALTTSEQIVQYYPLKDVISTWEVGSKIILKGRNDHQEFTDYGTIDILLPHEKFQYTYWSDNHGTERIAENHLTICYTLHNVGNGTALKVEHKGFKSEKLYLEMINVWEFLLASLKNFVECGMR